MVGVKLKSRWRRWAAAAHLVLGMSGMVGPTLVGAPVYGIFQGQQFLQAGDIVITQTRSAYWECWAHEVSSVRAIKVSSPLGNTISLSLDTAKENALLTRNYPSDEARAAVFPSGSYTLQLTGTDNSVVTLNLKQSDSAYPAGPRFSNLL